MTRKYLKTMGDGSGGGEASLTPDIYDVEVTDARVVEGKPMIFLDLTVLSGPDEGTVTSVGCWFPPEGHKAVFYFKKRMRGFAAQLAGVDDDSLEGDEEMQAYADALTGVQVTAKIGIQAKGEYKGSQELVESRALGEAMEDADDADDADDDEPEDEPAEEPTKPETKKERLARELAEAEAEEAAEDEEPAEKPKAAAKKPAARKPAAKSADKVGF